MNNIGISLGVHRLKEVKNNFHSEIELLFLMSGKARLTIGEEPYLMTENTVVLVNCEKQHSLEVIEPGMICQIMIDYQILSDYLGSDYFLFWCNSVSDKQGQYEKLIKLLQTIVATKHARHNADDFGVQGLYYQLLDLLTRRFLLDHNDVRYKEYSDESSERVHEIISYIQRNYKHEISLNELADRLYLSNAYLSRFFKKAFGQNFKDYVNSIRLIHAIDDLLVSEKNMTRIAMDNGFPSISRFNQVFKDNYGMAPQTYRELYFKNPQNTNYTDEDMDESIWEEMQEYVQTQHIESIDSENEIQNVYFEGTSRRMINKNWGRSINAGPLEDMIKGQVRRDLIRLHEVLDITYIRFWNVFDMIDFRSDAKYNFNSLDRTIEFLLQNHMKPFIVLGSKLRDIMLNFDEKIYSESRDVNMLLMNREAWQKLMNSFCRHLMVYFGAEEVSEWIFELRRPKEWDDFYNEQTDRQFEVWFEIAVKTLKEYFPKTTVGGCELVVGWREDPDKEVLSTLEFFKRMNYTPDFVSLSVLPYERTGISKTATLSMNPDYLRDAILAAKKLLNQCGFESTPIIISEWSNSVSNRNLYNEVPYKGAYLIQNLTMNMDIADQIVYWNASDVFGEFYDTPDLLYGGVGLFNKTGIAKPAFYAFDFLKDLYVYLIQCTRNYILTTDGYGNYRLLCNNMKALNYKYCSSYESGLRIEPYEYEKYFEDLDVLNYKFHISGVQDGEYLIRRRRVDKDYGSIFDELTRWECQTDIKHQDVQYLADICKPHMTLGTCNSHKGVLELFVDLPANAFELIEINKKYTDNM